jgi:hypothetical protein
MPGPGYAAAVFAAAPIEPDWSWTLLAACRGQATQLWFPERGESSRVPLSICARCPVRRPCLDYAVTHERVGVWGGTSERQRRVIRRRARACLTCDTDGTMRTVGHYDAEVSVRNLHANLAAWLERAHEGELVLIRRAGRPDAVLGPVERSTDDD